MTGVMPHRQNDNVIASGWLFVAPIVGTVLAILCLASLFSGSPVVVGMFVGLYALAGFGFGAKSPDPVLRVFLALTAPGAAVLLAIWETSWLWVGLIAGVASMVAAAVCLGRWFALRSTN